MKKVFETVLETFKDVSQDEAKIMMESPTDNNKTLSNLNDRHLNIMCYSGIKASYFPSRSSTVTKVDHTSQLNSVKDPDSKSFNDLLMNETIPVTLYDNLLTFRDTDKKLKLEGDILKLMTNKNYNVDIANLLDKELMYEYAKEIYFDDNASGKKSTRDKSFIKLPKSPAIMASGIFTSFQTGNFIEICDRLKLLLQEKQTANKSGIIIEEIIALVDNLSEFKCLSTKQQKFLLPKLLD